MSENTIPAENALAETFAQLELSASTLEILEKRSFVTPTPIQAMVIPRLLSENTDIIAQARTGTGKTAAFALPVIERLLADGEPKSPVLRALILAPTRELAMQISTEVNAFVGNRPLRVATIYGGQPIDIQFRALSKGADIVVGTPGRVIDMMNRGKLDFQAVEFAILDEADEMLDMGFVEDIETILAAAPEDKQMLMFSATVPKPILAIAEKFMHNAEYITAPVTADEEAAPLTEQWACEVRREDKFQALRRILNAEGKVYGMIFCRTRVDVDELTVQLQRNGFSAEALHGELTQNQRTRVIDQFKSHRFDMLVATDVAARGIDVNDLTHVINYALPQNADLYTHRIGRTGRAGKKGIAISIYSPSEGRKFAMLRKATGNKLEQRPLPDAKAIIQAKKLRFKDELSNKLNTVNPVYLDLALELGELFDPAQLTACLLEMRFKRELLPEYYPSLGRGKRERRPGGFDRAGHHEPSRPRRHRESKTDAESAEKAPRTEKPRREKRKEKPARDKNHAAKPARPKLRDWALTLEGEAPKKRKK